MSSIVKNTGKLFVLSGPSGAGKGTICKRLLEETDKLDLSVSMTTRKPRIGETDGVSYFFTEKEVFQEHIKKGNLLSGGDEIQVTGAREGNGWKSRWYPS